MVNRMSNLSGMAGNPQFNDAMTMSAGGTTELHDFKVCMLGEAGVGKPCIANRFVKGVFEEKMPTIGATFVSREINVQSKSTGTNGRTKLKIWDTAGNEKYRSLTKKYY